MTEIKSVRIDEDIGKLIKDLGLDFSSEVRQFLNKKYKTLRGLDRQIKELKELLSKLELERTNMYIEKRKMTYEEKLFLIETGDLIKRNKSFIVPRMKVLYEKFGKLVESEEEFLELIDYAKRVGVN